MKLVAGFGAGMQTGSTCGAILSAISILSMKYVEQKAHECADIKPVTTLLLQKVEEKMGSQLCLELKERNFRPQVRCLKTVEEVCDLLEETLQEYTAV